MECYFHDNAKIAVVNSASYMLSQLSDSVNDYMYTVYNIDDTVMFIVLAASAALAVTLFLLMAASGFDLQFHLFYFAI